MKVDRKAIKEQAKLELARREFFYFCHLLEPDFYKEDREYLETLCKDMQDFLESDDDVAIYNLPPRHGKSRTGGNLTKWVFGKDQTQKVMTGSYNETLSTTFSKAVRNGIQEVKADPDRIVYSDIFPGVCIKKGDGAMNLWSLEGGYNNYLATSPTGTATGFLEVVCSCPICRFFAIPRPYCSLGGVQVHKVLNNEHLLLFRQLSFLAHPHHLTKIFHVK